MHLESTLSDRSVIFIDSSDDSDISLFKSLYNSDNLRSFVFDTEFESNKAGALALIQISFPSDEETPVFVFDVRNDSIKSLMVQVMESNRFIKYVWGGLVDIDMIIDKLEIVPENCIDLQLFAIKETQNPIGLVKYLKYHGIELDLPELTLDKDEFHYYYCDAYLDDWCVFDEIDDDLILYAAADCIYLEAVLKYVLENKSTEEIVEVSDEFDDKIEKLVRNPLYILQQELRFLDFRLKKDPSLSELSTQASTLGFFKHFDYSNKKFDDFKDLLKKDKAFRNKLKALLKSLNGPYLEYRPPSRLVHVMTQLIQ